MGMPIDGRLERERSKGRKEREREEYLLVILLSDDLKLLQQC